MKKSILIYGSIAGIVIIGTMIAILRYGSDSNKFSEWLGYLIMIVVFSVIFIGIKRYRDQELGGVIKFSKALVLGIGISGVASTIYVFAWEVNLAATDYAFIDEYTQMLIATKQASGINNTELAAYTTKVEEMKRQYANPLFRIPITFTEIFPVGLLISLLSATVLRNSRFLPATR